MNRVSLALYNSYFLQMELNQKTSPLLQYQAAIPLKLSIITSNCTYAATSLIIHLAFNRTLRQIQET
ncbi:hypothetical protein LFZ15_15945 [Salmonella enterica subsp. enterica serovar Hvittingfoss str. SA20014981]|nr:hypothetical protein LFZ15_15945 [Salmonella enterica subsp. enterica serovar Hvittingfoss str. SA20014981]